MRSEDDVAGGAEEGPRVERERGRLRRSERSCLRKCGRSYLMK